jgi:hypothetical protein
MIPALLYLLPPLLLIAALLLRRYPGERQLIALARARRKPRRRCIAPAWSQSRPSALLPRGGKLIASSLAVRPPPVAAAA